MARASEQKLFYAGSQDLRPQDALKLSAEETLQLKSLLPSWPVCSRCFCCHLGVGIIGFGLSPAPPGPSELWCLRESSLTFHRGGGFPAKSELREGLSSDHLAVGKEELGLVTWPVCISRA